MLIKSSGAIYLSDDADRFAHNIKTHQIAVEKSPGDTRLQTLGEILRFKTHIIGPTACSATA